MTEDLVTRMYQLLDQHPESETVLQFERECSGDIQLQQTWHDFLVEQYLAGNLHETWRTHIQRLPQFRQELTFQEHVQEGIRTLQENAIRSEIKRIFPQRHVSAIRKRGGTRFLIILSSSAAIGLLGIVAIWQLFLHNDDQQNAFAGVPVLMVEPFELEGVTEDMVIHGIPQRLPAKLAVAEGIYPITHYAMNNALDHVESNLLAKTLNATYTVSGKVQRSGDQLHIEASLFDVSKNKSVWKELFTVQNEAKAFDDVQDALSQHIVNTLDGQMSSAAIARMGMEVSKDADAVSLFLAGERKWAERTESALSQSINLFDLALRLDSTSTIIRGFLALAHATFAENDWGGDTNWNRAVAEAKRTLQADPMNPEALLVLGDYAESKEKDYSLAARYFAKALQSQPGDAKIHQAIAELHLRTGDIPTGLTHIRIARQTEPQHSVVRWVETKYLTASGRLEDAKLAADDLLALDPDYPNIQNFYWQYYLSKGDYENALAAIPSYGETHNWRSDYMRGMVYLDQKDYDALHELYPVDMPASFVLLEHIQKEEWELAYALLRQLLDQDAFDLLALSQTSGFAMFNKMKNDQGIQRILAEYGIRANVIPQETEPEI